jgi:homoserine acetyltransferase
MKEVIVRAGVIARGADLYSVEDRSFLIPKFRLRNGAVLRQAGTAYETYGRLAADGKNVVLITHGYTKEHAKWSPALREFLAPLIDRLG